MKAPRDLEPPETTEAPTGEDFDEMIKNCKPSPPEYAIIGRACNPETTTETEG